MKRKWRKLAGAHDAAHGTQVDHGARAWGPAVDRALRELPEDFRVTVVLVDMEGLSYQEAAAVEEVPVGTIRSRLFRARRLLQDQLFVYARDAGIRTTPPRKAVPGAMAGATQSNM